jgi:T4 superinfection immunity protein
MTIMLAFSGLLYFVPGLFAWFRHHRNRCAIFFLNLLTGWTLIGWIAALIWACVGEERKISPRTQVDKEPVRDRTAIYGGTPKKTSVEVWLDKIEK